MSYDKRITDIAAIAALAAAKNASVAPQLLLADITFTLADAVEDGRLLLPDSSAAALSAPSPASGEAMREKIAKQAFIEGIGVGWQSGRAGETMGESYAEDAWQASDACTSIGFDIPALQPTSDEVTVPGGMISKPFAYCCAEGGGDPASCDCVNKNHGTALFPAPKPSPDRVTEGELLRCPFCDGEASKDDIGSMKALYSVGCNNNDCPVECFVTSVTGYEEPIAAWNQRAAADARLREALIQCRDQFGFYAREHRAAGKVEKAATNERFAALASAALGHEARP